MQCSLQRIFETEADYSKGERRFLLGDPTRHTGFDHDNRVAGIHQQGWWESEWSTSLDVQSNFTKNAGPL